MKDDRKYTSSIKDEKLQDNFLKMVSNEGKGDDNAVNVLSLKNGKNEETGKYD